ncbi:MAG: UDP-N-acetylmuramate--L-alanine ligase, partial [Fidelibacterota bacterium]
IRGKTSCVVTGTHGKTTTTSMLGEVLTHAGLDPTLVVGGVVKSLNVNAGLGSGDIVVAEADEFDRSFLQLSPTYSIITSIDVDHMESYENQEDFLGAFTQFANAVPFYGSAVVCADEPLIQAILPRISRPVITYGLTDETGYSAGTITYEQVHSRFMLKEKGKSQGEVHLRVPGAHNVKNALAVIALGREMNIDFPILQEALEAFTGVKRRFEIKGTFQDILVVDDYAHHPTEVSATLRAIKNGWNRRLVTVFQPHLYSRTRELYEDFGRSLLLSDVVIVTEIYPAREEPIPGVDGQLIVNATRSMGHKDAYWIPEKEDVVGKLKEVVIPGDLVITLGAGNIWQVCDEYVTALKKESV